MVHFIDDECLEQVGKIDLKTISQAKLIDKQTFELHTANSDQIHLFTIYDVTSDNAELWVQALNSDCHIPCETMSDDDRILSEETYNDPHRMHDETEELLNESQLRSALSHKRSFWKRCFACIFGDN